MRYLYSAKVFRLSEVVCAVIKFRSTWFLNYSIISVKNKTMPNHKQSAKRKQQQLQKENYSRLTSNITPITFFCCVLALSTSGMPMRTF